MILTALSFIIIMIIITKIMIIIMMITFLKQYWPCIFVICTNT